MPGIANGTNYQAKHGTVSAATAAAIQKAIQNIGALIGRIQSSGYASKYNALSAGSTRTKHGSQRPAIPAARNRRVFRCPTSNLVNTRWRADFAQQPLRRLED